MENELRTHLAACFAAYMAVSKQSPSTVAQAAAGDWRFFDRIQSSSFTARKYDAVMQWFSANWPKDAVWPKGVARPRKTRAAA